MCDKKANFGYIKEKWGVPLKEVESVFVLVAHYAFTREGLNYSPRVGNAEDVEKLRNTFQNKRNCSFCEIPSPTREYLLELLGNEEELLKHHRQNSKSSSWPQLFILFILSHGSYDGIIFTDHLQQGKDDVVFFNRQEVFQSLAKLKNFKNCLKFVVFGPCRGENEDRFVSAATELEPNKPIQGVPILSIKNMPVNLAVAYSTLETILAKRDDDAKSQNKGTLIVRSFCDVLDELPQNSTFADVLTMVQHRVHKITTENFYITGQTPEFALYQHHQLIIRCLKGSPSPAVALSSHDGKGNTSNVRNTPEPKDPKEHFYKWQSNSGATLRGRRAAIFHNAQSHPNISRMEAALTGNLNFETLSYKCTLKDLESFYSNSKVLDYENIGCCIVAFFSQMQADDSGEISIKIGDIYVPLGHIISTSIGPNNKHRAGKPYLFFFINQCSEATDNLVKVEPPDYSIRATQHSGYLAFVSLSEEPTKKLLEIFEGNALKNGTSIQELLAELLDQREAGDDIDINKVLITSTLQFSLDFPDLPSRFVEPNFTIDGSRDIVTFEKLTLQLQSPGNGVWIVSSNSGMGKSTLMLELLNVLRKTIKQKIVLVQFMKFFEFFFQPENFSLNSLLAKALAVEENTIEDLKRNYGFFVLLDGFDEIRYHFEDQIIEIFNELISEKIPFMVTTRPEEEAALKNIINETGSVKTVKIENLDHKHQIELMQIVTQKTKEECETLINSYSGSAMKDVLTNPLHLTWVCQCKNAENLWEVYVQMVNEKVATGMELKENIKIDNPVGKKQIDDRIKLLEKIAFEQVTETKTKEFSERESVDINNTGVARVSANLVTFDHKTVSDFLVCQKFVRDLKSSKHLKGTQILMSHDGMTESRKFFDSYISQVKENDKKICSNLKEVVQKYVPKESVLNIVGEHHENLFFALKEQIQEAVESQISNPDLLNATLEKTLKFGTKTTFAKFLLEFPFPIWNEDLRENAVDMAITRLHESEDVLFIAQELHKRDNSLVRTRPSHRTTFQLAAEYMDVALCRWLLKDESGNIVLDRMGKNPFDHVAQNQAHGVEVGKYLLSVGVKPTVESFKKAVRFNNFQLAELLFNTLADGNKRLGGYNILQFGVKLNSIAFVEHVFQLNKDLLLQLTDFGKTVLHVAAEYADLNMCKTLEKFDLELHSAEGHAFCQHRCQFLPGSVSNHLADISSPGYPCPSLFHVLTQCGENVLHCAALNKENFSGLAELAEYLIEHGVEVDLKNKEGLTPFQIAILNEKVELSTCLMANGADVTQNCTGLNALQMFVKKDCIHGAKEVYKTHKSLMDELTDKGETCLHLAVKYSSFEMCQWLLDLGADVHAVTNEGNSAMHLVYHQSRSIEVLYDTNGDFEIFGKIADWVQLLHSKGARVDLKNNEGNIPFQVAVERGYESVAIILIRYGVAKDIKCKGLNQFHFVIKHGNIEDIKFVHQMHSDLIKEKTDDGDYAIHLAAKCCRNLEIFEWLIQNGAEIYALNRDGDNILHISAAYGNLDSKIIQYFVDLGVEINAKNNRKLTPLQIAAERSNLKRVTEFVNLGAELFRNGATYNILHTFVLRSNLESAKLIHSVNKEVMKERTGDGRTALHLAVRNSDRDMFEWLIENGADVHALTEQHDNILHLVAPLYTDSGREILEYVLETFEVNVNQKNIEGKTPIFQTLVLDNILSAKKLFEKGANLRIACGGGDSLLRACFEQNNQYSMAIVEFLSDKGVLEDITDEGENALHLAARYTNLEICKSVQSHVADLLATTNDGSTVLHMAALNKNYGREIIEYFVPLGLESELSKPNKDGKSAVQVASSNENRPAVNILKEFGSLIDREDDQELL